MPSTMQSNSHSIQSEAGKQALARRFEQELTGNILPFWMRYTLDHENGGFYGAITPSLQILNDVPRSAVLCARILWTFSAAYRIFRDERYLSVARHAYDYTTQRFWDSKYGGIYWSLDCGGRPISDRKHVYAQAFAIYGLSEFYRATGEAESLKLAQELFGLIETHTFDSVNLGNLECCSRTWQPLDDMRLGAQDLNCAKSMNTLLHLMEAYTNLARVWQDVRVKAKQRELIQVFLKYVVDPQTWHLKLFFDELWRTLSDKISFGHDIEASWLLVEAAHVLGEPNILSQAQMAAAKMAQAVYAEGRDVDGSVLYEASPHGLERDKHWWVQAEAVVGFYNASQISGQTHLAEAALQCWGYIEDKFVDHEHGDWFKVLNRQGSPYAEHFKVGPWECPYHHSRVCFEMIARLNGERTAKVVDLAD